jgi:hypothetical protein
MQFLLLVEISGDIVAGFLLQLDNTHNSMPTWNIVYLLASVGTNASHTSRDRDQWSRVQRSAERYIDELGSIEAWVG